jgi:response regulator RpfG family c-di-GMP phosphodiesterase
MLEKILCVDDELNIVLAMQRQLRKQFHVESALGAEQALATMERDGPFAVIVSDLQMPGMNGLDLLGRARELSPDTIRIMLTGQADLTTAIAAVNKNSIFRFLTKPCSAEELIGTLEAAIDQYHLVTAERLLLENTLRASVKVLTEVLSLVHPAAFSRASRIHRYVRHMAAELKLRNAWQFEVAALLSQIGCITMDPGTLDRVYTGEELSEEEKKMFAAHPAAGRDLLLHIPRLEAVAQMIAGQSLEHQQTITTAEPPDAVFMGVHLMRAAIEFDRLITRDRSKEEALAQMRQRESDYDPACMKALETFVPHEATMELRVLKSAELRTTMVVDQDVRSKNGLLLLAKGQEVTPSVLGRLRAFASKTGIVEPIRVLVTKVETTQSLTA